MNNTRKTPHVATPTPTMKSIYPSAKPSMGQSTKKKAKSKGGHGY